MAGWTSGVAIVTGASANIAGALALGLAEERARVVGTDLSADTAQASAARITDAGGEALAAVGDVTDENHAPAVVEQAVLPERSAYAGAAVFSLPTTRR